MNSIKSVWCHQRLHPKDEICSILAHTDDFLGITTTCLSMTCTNSKYSEPLDCWKCKVLVAFTDIYGSVARILCTNCFGKRCTPDDYCIVCATRIEWERVHVDKGLPSEIPEFTYDDQPLHALIYEAGLASSKAEARRLIKQNAVKIINEKLDKTPSKGDIIKVGKRRFVKLI